MAEGKRGLTETVTAEIGEKVCQNAKKFAAAAERRELTRD
jgi:hypothetical protein